jgi:Oxidoreductase molybdopterin binding domain
LRNPWVNTALLVLLAAELASGVGGLMAGAESLRPILWIHGVVAYAILALLWWKGAVVLGSISRRPLARFPRASFLALTGLLVATLATGLYWVFGGRVVLFEYSLITIHAVLAVAILVLLAWHVAWMRFIFGVRRALDRRAILRLGAGGVAGFALWQSAGLASGALGLPGAQRRFTGSYALPSFTGDFPTVSWLFDDPTPVDPQSWRLTVDGAVEKPLVLTYEQLAQLATASRQVTIDCTGGWYSQQEWQGVPVGRLLNLAQPKPTALSVVFEAVSGYYRRYSLAEAPGLLLATHVGGEPLTHGHGFPARLVAPEHRGYDWVKWVTRIRVVESSWFWQPPLPLQ